MNGRIYKLDWFDHSATLRGREPFVQNDGWGGKLYGEQSDDFVFRGGLAFPKAMACGNYRTPTESPYAYGPHVVSGPVKAFSGEGYSADYDDRLRQFYPERWSEAIAHLGGERLKHADLSKVSKFLSTLHGYSVQCVQVVEGCNVSNGYPYLIFVSRKLGAKAKKGRSK